MIISRVGCTLIEMAHGTLEYKEYFLTFRNPDFFNTNMQAYFKGILFHYYKEFPYICIYFWKGNILENLNLLNKKIS